MPLDNSLPICASIVTLVGIQSLLESSFCLEKPKYIYFFLEKQVAVYILFLLAETKQD